MGLISTVLLASFIALIIIAVWHELRVYGRFRRVGLAERRHRRRLHRRLLGLLFLTLAVAILINASAFERVFPDPFLRLAWIGMAFVSVLIAVWLALRDLSETGKMAQEEAQRVVVESLSHLQGEIARAKQQRSGESDSEDSAQGTTNHEQSGKKSRRSRRTRPTRQRPGS